MYFVAVGLGRLPAEIGELDTKELSLLAATLRKQEERLEKKKDWRFGLLLTMTQRAHWKDSDAQPDDFFRSLKGMLELTEEDFDRQLAALPKDER